jgi:hypothetical protein
VHETWRRPRGLVEACIDQNVAGLAADQPDEITEIGAFIVHVGQEVVLMGLPARHRRIAQSVNLIVIGQRIVPLRRLP